MRLANIRQRLGRYERAARVANERQDWARLDRYAALLDRDVAAYEKATAAPANVPPQRPATRAAQFTPAATAEWSDDDLVAEFGRVHDDPEAQEQILATLDWRAEMERQRDADIAEMLAEKERERAERYAAAWTRADEDTSPLTNPTRRPARRLTPEQMCREEYDAHLESSFLAAENDCRGVLLNREGQAQGIDAISLFSGPASRVQKYASEELKTWYGRNGRVTYTEWKYMWHGRESDRKAARTARLQSLGEAVA